MHRRALLASLSLLALAGSAKLVALTLDPEATARLATRLGQPAPDTGQDIALYLGWAAPLSTTLFTALVWVTTGGFRAFVAHRDSPDTRTTAEHASAPVASVTVPLVAIFTCDQLVIVAGVGVVLLASVGAVFAGRSNARGVITGSLCTVAPAVGGSVVASLVAGPAVARTVMLALPLAVDYALDIASVHGRLHLSVAASALAFTVPAWAYSPPAARAADFDPETTGFALDFAVVAVPLSPPFAAVGYATTRTAGAE